MPDNLALSGSMYSGEPCGSSCAGYVRHPFSKNGPLLEHATIHQCLSCLLALVICTCSTVTRRLTFNTIVQHCSIVLVAIQPKSGSGIMWWSSGLLQLPTPAWCSMTRDIGMLSRREVGEDIPKIIIFTDEDRINLPWKPREDDRRCPGAGL